ncbi:MAG: EAL domain-containing protein [Gammaproteobacteria bacterium]|nr:MAG: EAL domain-containing protein [Gammaproteobacteria bacterium]
MQSRNRTCVLLIESNASDAERIWAALTGVEDSPYHLDCTHSLDEGIAFLRQMDHAIDIVMVDLASVKDASADPIGQIISASPHARVLVVGEDESYAPEAISKGAHEFLARSQIHTYWLPRAIRYLAQQREHDLIMQAQQKALHDEKARANVALNSIGDAILTTDLAGNIIYMNHAAEILVGCARENALGQPLSDVFKIINRNTRVIATNPALYAIEKNSPVGLESDVILVRADGSELSIEKAATPIHDSEGAVTGAIVVFHDVSESRTLAVKMTHLAQHDFLTGLPNRMLLTERLSQAIGLAYRNISQVALLFIDVDYFKHINDSLGHAVGDELLKSVAARLVSCVRATDTVCRQGGDEFVILLTEIERPQDAAVTAEKLFNAFSEPHYIGVHELHVSLSMGISVYPADGENADVLMQNADAAMYHAKLLGRNNFQFFKTEMNTRAVQRAFIEASLRRAIKRQEFELHYQPKVDIASGTIIGAEALIRWNDPQQGVIQPLDFLGIAEECGLIVAIGGWVLREVCSQLRAWLKEGYAIFPVSINVSAAELKHKYFLSGINQVLQETGLPPYYLELEFTETILMRDAELSISVLESLKDIGVQLSIDDFGTGYSSLSYLQRFPVDTLKIDKSFMRDLTNDSDNATIVSAIIAMGRNLKQRVLAEGVETAEQLAFLRTHRCNEAQGNYLSMPLPADQFAKIMTSNMLPVLSVRQRTDSL